MCDAYLFILGIFDTIDKLSDWDVFRPGLS